MAEENLKAKISLDISSYISSMKMAINNTKDFQDNVIKTKEMIKRTSSEKWEAKIKIDNKEAVIQINAIKKSMESFKQHKVINIAANDTAKEKVKSVEQSLSNVTKKPHNIVLNAVDKTKTMLESVRDKITNFKKSAHDIIFGEKTKKVFDFTVGSAMKGEQQLLKLQGSRGEEQGKKDFAWASETAKQTPFNKEEMIESISQFSKYGLNYQQYFKVAGDAATSADKSLSQTIDMLGTFKKGNIAEGVKKAKEFNITSKDWKNIAGLKTKKDGSLDASPKQVMAGIEKIIKAKYSGSMDKKANSAEGLIGNIKETISGMGLEIGGIDKSGEIVKGGMLDHLKKQLKSVKEILDKFQNSQAFEVIKNQINQLVSETGGSFTNWLQSLIDDPGKIEKAFNTAKDAVVEFAKSAKLVIDAAKEIFNALKPVLELMAENPKTSLGIFAGLKFGPGILDGVLNVTDKVKGAKDTFSKVKDFLGFSSKDKTSGGKIADKAIKGNKNKKSLKDICKPKGLKGNKCKKSLKDICNPKKSRGKSKGILCRESSKGIGKKGVKTGSQKGMKGSKNPASALAKGVNKAFSSIKKAVSSLNKVVGKALRGLLKTFKTVGKGIITVMKSVFRVIVANPIIAVILAIIAVAILLHTAWKNNWGGIRDKTKVVVDFIKKRIDGIKETFENVKIKCSEFVESIKEKWQALKDFFKNPIKGTVNLVKNAIDNITGGNDGKNEDNKKGKKNGKHAGGLSYVPFDGYTAELHKGERVLTARENRAFNSGFKPMQISINMNGVTVRENADIDRIAAALVNKLKEASFNAATI
ncbi:phage protein [Gottschalkia purinilytica]|uniref:Phage protein n=1 Tax=Gottschalkia purinilytica TaxID=1503 RepID=A0A0L0WF52_GOTPU|nr:hypothetical protein [Gottschalkia purinilytica]KNF10056.1 phage protein [Gottschalkia purinilytica]